MPLLSSHLLLLTHSLTTLTIAYVLLTSPSTLLSSHSLWILGESMHLRPLSLSPFTTKPPSSSLVNTSTTSEPLALAALLLAVSAITQALFAGGLAPISLSPTASSTRPKTDAEQRASNRELGEKVFALRFVQNQWMGVAGVRVLLMGALVGWIYVFHADRNQKFGSSLSQRPTGFALLANRVVFTGAMTDMLFWGYIWTVLREEGRGVMEMVGKMREEVGGRMLD